MQHVRKIIAALWNMEIDNETAIECLLADVPPEDLAEFIVDAFNRGWITRDTLGIDDEGRLL